MQYYSIINTVAAARVCRGKNKNGKGANDAIL